MKTALVTGGGGFVGKAIVKRLIERGVSCRVVGRHHYPEIAQLGGHCLQGDIRDFGFLRESFQGVDTVFHVAALAGIWGKWQDYHSINVLGTENVLQACRAQGVSRLVYTSTPSVVFNGLDIAGGDESLPYAEKFLCHYARSKVMAEKMVLAANGAALLTCAIRPHLVWGPGDPHLIPRLLASGRKRLLKKVGEGTNMVDITYVDNVAYAHVLAADNLSGNQTAAGKAYFINQEEPVCLWDWINALFTELAIPPVSNTVPFPVAYGVGALSELFYSCFRLDKEPRMTRFLAEQLAKSHYFSSARAQNDLGYSPIITTEQGMKHLVEWINVYENTL